MGWYKWASSLTLPHPPSSSLTLPPSLPPSSHPPGSGRRRVAAGRIPPALQRPAAPRLHCAGTADPPVRGKRGGRGGVRAGVRVRVQGGRGEGFRDRGRTALPESKGEEQYALSPLPGRGSTWPARSSGQVTSLPPSRLDRITMSLCPCLAMPPPLLSQ